MNERIRKLAQQAGIKITPMILDGVEYEYEDVDMDGSEDLEKFAELIIKDTMRVVAKNVSREAYLTAAEAIIAHYGVEE